MRNTTSIFFKITINILMILLFTLSSELGFSQDIPAQMKDDWRYKINIENTAGSLDSTVTVQDLAKQQVVFSGKLSEVFVDHYHNSEFHDGKLYIVHRTGGDEGFQTNENWTDSLWCYSGKDQKNRIYEVRGLDFRASDDNRKIAVIAADNEEKLTLLSGDGKILKEFAASDFGFEYIDFLSWDKNILWLTEGGPEPALSSLVKLDTTDYSHDKYDIPKLGELKEFSFNPLNGGMLVYSDYPFFFDEDEATAFEKKKTPVNLKLYLVKTKQEKILATSEGKYFEPEWVDNTTISYIDAAGKREKLDISKYL